MRIVYMGTPEIARVCLERIYQDGHDIAAVYTKIDTPKNRGMKLTASPVKEFALAHEIPVIQPQTFKDETVVEELRAQNAIAQCEESESHFKYGFSAGLIVQQEAHEQLQNKK